MSENEIINYIQAIIIFVTALVTAWQELRRKLDK